MRTELSTAAINTNEESHSGISAPIGNRQYTNRKSPQSTVLSQQNFQLAIEFFIESN